MRQKYDKGYIELFEEVKKNLPNYYGVILFSKYPHLNQRQVYNVIHNGIQNWDILNALADITGIKTPIKETV